MWERDHFTRLLGLLFEVIQAEKDHLPKDKTLAYMQVVAGKVYQHAAAAHTIAESGSSITLRDGTVWNLPDWASVEVLARACLEAYLMLHYVYLSPEDHDEREFRYAAWMLTGFIARQNVPQETQAAKDQMKRDERFIDSQRRRVMRTQRFGLLTNRQKTALLAGRLWPVGVTLSRLASDALGQRRGPLAYAFLSNHAHAGALSVVQLGQTRGEAGTRAMTDGALVLITVIVALTTDALAKTFVRSRKTLRDHPDRELNELIVGVSKRL